MTDPVPTPRYRAIVAEASNVARQWGHGYVGVEHLFLAILGDRSAVPAQVLAHLVDLDQAEAELRAVMESDSYHTTAPWRPPEVGDPGRE